MMPPYNDRAMGPNENVANTSADQPATVRRFIKVGAQRNER